MRVADLRDDCGSRSRLEMVVLEGAEIVEGITGSGQIGRSRVPPH